MDIKTFANNGTPTEELNQWFSILGVNFINVLRATFAPIFFAKKLQSQNVIREKLRKALSYEIDTWLDCKR